MIGAKQRSGKVKAHPVQSTNAETLGGFIDGSVERGSTVYTDGSNSYGTMEKFKHDAVNHSGGRVRPGPGAHQWHRVLLGDAESAATMAPITR